ncbi:MAG: hypothetical protein ABIW38_01760 [Ferruginibacter sp.]
MAKDSIVQFVGYITQLNQEVFEPDWEQYSQTLANKKTDLFLLEQTDESKNKFRYISKHIWPEADFNHSMVYEKPSRFFPEHSVKIVQTGGYFPLQSKKRQKEETDCKLVAFLSHDENDLEYYQQLAGKNHVEVHQAYYESCSYGYVLEFSVSERDADELLQALKKHTSVEAGIYRECLVPHI